MMDEQIRILHVDDDPTFAEVSADLLEGQDDRFVVRTAPRASEGVDLLAEESFDCIVSDYDMPGTNGIEFLETVRGREPDIPFILFTGKGSEAVASEAISAGVSDYLQKESTPEQYELLANRILSHVERIRAQQERKRQLNAIETAQEGISILDDEGRFVYVNDAYAELYGYDPGEMIGEHWGLIYPDEDIPEIREEVLPVVEKQGFWRGETTGVRADGSTFIEDHALALTDDGGLVCTIRDVTEQRKQERELKRQKEQLEEEIERRKAAEGRYRSLFEHNPIVIWEHDFSEAKQYLDELTEDVADIEAYLEVNPDELDRLMGKIEIVDVNENAVDYYGAESKEHLLANLDRVLTEEVRGMTTDLWQSVAAGDSQFRTEIVAHTFDGERRHQILELYVPGAPDGDYSRVYLTGTDITERTERERTLTALHEAAQEIEHVDTESAVYGTLIETAQQVLDFDLAVVDVERDGYLVQEAWTLEVEDRDYWERTSIEEDDSFAIRAYSRQETIVVDDLRDAEITPADPEYRSALTVPIGEFGTFQAVYSQPGGFDEHDREFAELLIDHARAKLSQLQDTQELQERTAELERQNKRLDEFASFVSHDLRNPLNVADLRLDLVAQECDSDHLADVDGALDRMERLIDDLLTLTRYGRTVEETDQLQLADLATESWKNVDTGEATLECTTAQTVDASQDQLASLLENLFRNSVEHGGEGVTITVGDISDGTGFYVADDGGGIPGDEREQIFESGYSTKEAGTGLGLVIARDVVEAHGWEMAVTESESGGARFEIRADGQT